MNGLDKINLLDTLLIPYLIHHSQLKESVESGKLDEFIQSSRTHIEKTGEELFLEQTHRNLSNFKNVTKEDLLKSCQMISDLFRAYVRYNTGKMVHKKRPDYVEHLPTFVLTLQEVFLSCIKRADNNLKRYFKHEINSITKKHYIFVVTKEKLEVFQVEELIYKKLYCEIYKVLEITSGGYFILKKACVPDNHPSHVEHANKSIDKEIKALQRLQPYSNLRVQKPPRYNFVYNSFSCFMSHFYSGKDLYSWLLQVNPSTERRIKICYQIMQEIAFPMISNGIRHLDIKPSNLLAEEDEKMGLKVVLADVEGCSFDSDKESFTIGLTTTGFQTYQERINLINAALKKDEAAFRKISKAWDLYSFAVTFFIILANNWPYPLTKKEMGFSFPEDNAVLDLKPLRALNNPKITSTLRKMLDLNPMKRLSLQEAKIAWENIVNDSNDQNKPSQPLVVIKRKASQQATKIKNNENDKRLKLNVSQTQQPLQEKSIVVKRKKVHKIATPQNSEIRRDPLRPLQM